VSPSLYLSLSLSLSLFLSLPLLTSFPFPSPSAPFFSPSSHLSPPSLPLSFPSSSSLSLSLCLCLSLFRACASASSRLANFRARNICIHASKHDFICLYTIRDANMHTKKGRNTYIDIPTRRRLGLQNHRSLLSKTISISKKITVLIFHCPLLSFFFSANSLEFYFRTFSLYRCILKYMAAMIDAIVILRVCKLLGV